MAVKETRRINKKVPGLLPPPPKSEIDGKLSDLGSKMIPELIELRDRQRKLLNNRNFISKLPDKGAKIQALYDKIELEIKSKQEEEITSKLFSNMNLTPLDKESVEDMEWKGKIEYHKHTCLDSDDDSDPEDVLQILTQHTDDKKKVKIIKPEKSSITPEDLLNIDEIPHVRYIVQKTESNIKAKENFKPYKTTKSNAHDPDKEMLRKKNKHWEITAATPPPIVHGPAKILSINESLNLQKNHNIHLKEIETKHAAEKLLEKVGLKMPELPKDTAIFGEYRTIERFVSDDSETDSDPEGSDKEVHDDEPERGGVIINVLK
ncbi:DNA-directed RNA polymerase II subunit GRINL1A [Leptidea sinapis]|uniref:DNA-directed RNA polymerase II subunit GRINL1A n=1 Tax=Leptidea sinapis TaxID=189913 RepID=UPI00214415D1|nr:DNA-directed RNA polymerase II subunit GRINL1A [Leptidea sinapis]